MQTRRVGDASRQSGAADGGDHVLDGQRGEVGGGTVGEDRFVYGLIFIVVGDTRVVQVQRHALRRRLHTPSRLTDAEHGVGAVFAQCGADHGDGFAENDRKDQLDDFQRADPIGHQRQGLLRGVDRLAAEGLEAG